ncbi:MAG: hypothetical protein ACKPKO_65555, partial [Candidatus Fonsibacter sp.]
GAFKRDAAFWGEHVTVDHVVKMGELSQGIAGSHDVFVITDIFSGLRVAYPLLDKSAGSTTMAIRMFAGKRMVHKLYSDRSGEIHKALKNLAIMPHGSQTWSTTDECSC